MNIELLWQFDGPVETQQKLFFQLDRAAAAYLRRTRQRPEVCHAHSDVAVRLGAEALGVEVVADPMVAPNALWVGRRSAVLP